MHVQVGGSVRERVESQDGQDGIVCALDGHRHAQACIYPCTNVQACAKLINTGMNAHTGTQMQAATCSGCNACFLLRGGNHRPQHGPSQP
jgi:hypothetical protein